MENLPHIPVCRLGRTYESLNKSDIVRHADGETLAVVSTVNAGIIRKDLRKLDAARAALKKHTVADLIEISSKVCADAFWCEARIDEFD